MNDLEAGFTAGAIPDHQLADRRPYGLCQAMTRGSRDAPVLGIRLSFGFDQGLRCHQGCQPAQPAHYARTTPISKALAASISRGTARLVQK